MEKIEQIVQMMTLEDKVAFCTGKDFWRTKDYEKYGIPSMFMCDGPLGLRKQMDSSDMLGINKSVPSTCFPASVTTAGSWDPELLERIGKAFAEEAEDQDVDLVLGPGANMKRNPLCGRNFEYYSEDPYLAGKMAAGFIRGAEGNGLGTCLKHFAVNSQETSRFTSDGIVDERTLRELYLTAFEIAVKEGKPSSVMSSYPKLNGVHCSDSRKLLTDILRTEWGFDGIVITDWGGMYDRIASFRAGGDLNMPGGSNYMEKEVCDAVRNGELDEEDINTCVRRILKMVFKVRAEEKSGIPCDYGSHHRLAREATCAGAVLLKNEDSILPLKQDKKTAVIGYMAKQMRYQGAGSSHINPKHLCNPLECLSSAVYAEGCDQNGVTNDDLIREVQKAAEEAEQVIVFAGLPDRYESEGFDRDDMKMPDGHLRMIEAAASVNPNTVVVLLCGSAVECDWADHVKGILYMGLPGEAGGEAAADLLYGRVNPSGKLAESWPYRYEDVPSSEIYKTQKDALYAEGIYTGYRYYDKAGMKVRWPFGYGLSYTSFAYSDLSADRNTVSVTVENTGGCAGSEAVQLYIGMKQNGLHRPVRELKRFAKVHLEPGEKKTVSFDLDDRCFAVWSDGWKVQGGTYCISIGSLCTEVRMEGTELPAEDWQKDSFYENCQGKPVQKQWEKMLGRAYEPAVLKKGSFTMDNTVEEMRDYSLMMKIMYKSVEMVIAKGLGRKPDYSDPEFRMMMNAAAGGPLRSMQISGGIRQGIMQGMLEIANGHFFKGIYRMIRGI